MAKVEGLPGVRTTRTSTPRKILADIGSAVFLPGGKILRGAAARDPLNTGDLDVLRDGLVMGEITASGKYAPSILGVLASAYDKDGSAATTMTVSAATAVELVRRLGASGTFKITGPPTAAGTVVTETITYSAVSQTTGAITVTTAAADYVAGSFVQPVDGSDTPLCLLYAGGYGVKVTDQDAVSIDTNFATPLIGGTIDASQIINYPSDASLKTWLKTTKLNAVCQFTYDDAF